MVFLMIVVKCYILLYLSVLFSVLFPATQQDTETWGAECCNPRSFSYQRRKQIKENDQQVNRL